MNYYVYTLHDELSGIYETPLMCANTVREIRAYGMRMAMAADNPEALKDYAIEIVGMFDTTDGYITMAIDGAVNDDDVIKWNLYDLYEIMNDSEVVKES